MQVQKLLLPYVKGLFFFGVPHQGFDIARIKEILPKDSPRLKLIEDMSTKASVFDIQYPRLHGIVCREKIQVRSFYERFQTPRLEMVCRCDAAVSLKNVNTRVVRTIKGFAGRRTSFTSPLRRNQQH